MPRALLLSVKFHDGRYHGVGDWPPAPARLFQALVAGTAHGQSLGKTDREALAWLETLSPPAIAVPTSRDGQGFYNYVPNNDLDAVAGDPLRIGKIRTAKTIKPRIFDPAHAFLYAWNFDAVGTAEKYAQEICAVAERLYQLGRGVDMAWAWAEVLNGEEIEFRFADHGGVFYYPAQSGTGTTLLSPQIGSLASLELRFLANQKRFNKIGDTKQTLFSQPPKPRFSVIAYNSPARQFFFDLRETTNNAPLPPWPLTKAAQLVEKLRDEVVKRLKTALPKKEALIEQVLVGRYATESDKSARIRIIPLPSIGHVHADHAIRRVLIEIPPNCPISATDIAWGFSGLDLANNVSLYPVKDPVMSKHYGIPELKNTRIWRTITPIVLPQSAARRRMNPSHVHESAEQKNGSERASEEDRAANAVFQALRHAHITTCVDTIQVQREPFESKGARVEAFAPETRYTKERLWHVKITFTNDLPGPLIIGDGRYMGLGLMAPIKIPGETNSIFSTE